MRHLTLLLPAARPGLTHDLIASLHETVQLAVGVPVAAASLPADLFSQILETPRDVVAWAPPLIARDLIDAGLASPIAVAQPPVPHTSILVSRPTIDTLADIAGTRVGWVSRLSATGYRIPRLYLESFGLDVSRLFASERFYGSHRAVAQALLDGEIDVAATHSGRLRDALESASLRVLTSIGPIPADMILASPRLPATARDALAESLRVTPAGDFRFVHARSGHLDLLDQLTPIAPSDVATPRKSGFALA
jgi:ABC-type phosphate/phosphonate transport system substrate-binding protein